MRRRQIVLVLLVAVSFGQLQAQSGTPASWSAKSERIAGGPEADLLVRTGDINNLGFGWPQGFDPFSGKSTPSHDYPWKPPAGAPAGAGSVGAASAPKRESDAASMFGALG